MSEDNLDNPVTRARARLFYVLKFLFGILRYAGLFLIGIIVGMGIVLKDPMPNKEQAAKIVKLEKENKDLNDRLANSNKKIIPDVADNQKPIVKESFVIN